MFERIGYGRVPDKRLVTTGGRHMTSSPKKTRRQRGSLSAEQIIDGAFELASQKDLDSMTMPELASRLGVGVTSIYWYFRKKDDLLRGMSDRAVRAVQEALPAPADAPDWRTFLHDYFTDLRQIFRSDDTLADLTLVRIRSYSLDSTHFLYKQYEDILEYLIACGFSPLHAWNVFSTAYTFTRGVVIGERTQRLNNSPILDDRQSKLIVPETMPRLASLIVQENIMLAMVSDDDFRFGLELLLDAFERVLANDRDAGRG
jgi:AcrR family transcriptional regulator